MTDMKSRPTPDEFEDPLKNYDPSEYGDSLERALAEEAVAAIQSTPYTSISPDTTVERSLKLLTDRGVSWRRLLRRTIDSSVSSPTATR